MKRASPDIFHKKISALRAKDLEWVKALPWGGFRALDAAEWWGVSRKTAGKRLVLLRVAGMVYFWKKFNKWYVRRRK